MCLINDYSLIADLHIFDYKSAECASISLECIKVKLLILNNCGGHTQNPNFKTCFFLNDIYPLGYGKLQHPNILCIHYSSDWKT